jgi:hypothetical protein
MGTADRPDEPERPTQDQDLYVYSEEDVARVCAELHAMLREQPDVDEPTAEETARYCYELLTGDWLLE